MLDTADQLLKARLEGLTERERMILELMVYGYSNKAIGERLHYDPFRISVMISEMYGALGIVNGPEINSRVVATNIYLRVTLRENCSCSAM